MMKVQKRWQLSLGLFALAVGGGLLALPSVFAELFIYSQHHQMALLPPPRDPGTFAPRPGAPAGTIVAGYWRVQQIAPDTFAIGEPANAPDNYEYLLLGRDRGLLIDAGATDRDIHAVLNKLTTLPVTAIPTHLHWDHTRGLRHFSAVALIDLPQTRALQSGSGVRLTRHAFINDSPLSFPVSEWIKPDQAIDLGGRRITVLSTPGHTASSASFYDAANRILFTGDFLYPTSLYAFMPDSSLSAYVQSADRMLEALPRDARLMGAHCCRNDGPPQAPWLTLADLAEARDAIRRIEAGNASGSTGTVIRRFPVNPRMTLLTLYPFANR